MRSKPRHSKLALAGKTALITGASRGIGLAIAEALAQEGCNLVLAARTQLNLDRAAKRLKNGKAKVLTLACDIREPEQVRSLIAQVRRQFGRLDILINNAGIGHRSLDLAKLPFSTWREVIATNLDGLFLVTQMALPLMKRGGSIVNNLSIAAKKTFPGSAAYNASKHGALALTNTLREELRSRGIRVIALLPGATNTEIWGTLWPQAPRKKMMSAETVAQAVVDALKLPANTTPEEITLLPSVGVL